MASKVRYLTISRVAIEMVCALSENENAQFLKIMFSCFKQLEDGEMPDFEDTESPILNIALREAVAELVTGYENYLKKQNARKNGEEKRRSISDQSAINQRSTEDVEKEKDLNKMKQDYLYPHPGGMESLQKAEIAECMKKLGLVPDEGFWNTCNFYGYDRATEVLDYALSVEKDWTLYGITKIIKDGLEKNKEGGTL